MKKYIHFLFAALLLGTSCSDTREDYVMEDTAYFPNSDLQKTTLYVMNPNDYVHQVWIHKAGYFQGRFAGRVELDYNYLVQYNTENDTDYEMLDQKYYTFNRDFVIEAGTDETSVALNLKTEQILQDKGYGTYYIPLSVNSLTPGEKVYVDKSHFILVLEMKKPILIIDGVKGVQKGDVFVDLENSTVERRIDITAKLDVLTPEELEVTYGYNKDEDNLLTAEELTHMLTKGFEYAPSVKIAVDKMYGENYLTLKPAEIPVGKWILPIRLKTTNEKVGMEEAENWLKLTVVKGSLDDQIPLEGNHIQGNSVILSSDETVSDEVIADVSEIGDLSISIAGKNGGASPGWLQVTMSGGKIAMTVTGVNASTWEEQIATIKLIDNETWLEKEIVVRRGMKDCGTLLNKSSWSLVGSSSNISSKGHTFPRLFDNFWPSTKAEVGSGPTLSYIEVDKCPKETPAQFIFDLGENPHAYNAIGLMPRLQWIGNSPKYLKIEVCDEIGGNVVSRSEEMTNWTLIGAEEREAFTDTDINKRGDGMENLYQGKSFIKWHSLGNDMKYRYIRLSMWGTWSGSICLDEIFVAKK